MSKLVIEKHVDDFNQFVKTLGNSILDLSIDNLPFLIQKEAKYNSLGQRVSKSYFDLTGKEAVRINYNYIIENYTFNGVVYPNVFIGFKKTFNFYNWADEVGFSKKMQKYEFDLRPIYDVNNNITGFTSFKMQQIQDSEQKYINYNNNYPLK